MSIIEELQAASTEADQELSRQTTLLRGLRLELERSGEALPSREYSELSARIEQAELRMEKASRKAHGCRDALDAERSAEAAKLRREQAQREYDAKLNAMNAAHAEIEQKQKAIRDLQNELPMVIQRKNSLLYEVDRAKSELQRLGA